MAFLDDAKKGGRVALTIVEIGLDNKLSPSGVEHHCDGQVPWGQRFFASVSAIDFAPTKLVFFDGLSHVGQVSISFQDFNFGAGDYFARLFAINPFYFNREIKIHTGYVQDGFNFANFRTRLYFIKKMDYDWESRKLKITAKDLFSKVDEKGVTFPDEKRGKLKTDLSIFSPGFFLSSFTGVFPDDIFAGDPAGHYVIDKEIILVTSLIGQLVVFRASSGTLLEEHKAGALMRKIKVFNDRNPIDALYDILATSAGLSAHIDQNDWNYIRDTYTLGDYLNGVIYNPLSIKAITKKICEQFALNIWWDDELQKLKIQAIGYSLSEPKKINWQENILNTGHSYSVDIQKAVTQTWFYYDKIDLTKGDSSENYGALYIYYDGNLEGEAGHRTTIIRKLYADLVGSGGLGVAVKTTSRIMARHKEGYQEITFRLDAKDTGLNVGDAVEITTVIIQDANGNPILRNFEVIEKEQISDTVWQYKASYAGKTLKARLITPNNMGNYAAESAENKLKYMFISNNSGLMNDASEGGTIV
jgi:hypothetical protein